VDSLLPEHLTDGSLHGGAHVAADGERLDVTTPGARWAYALSYRSGPSLIAADGAVLRNVRIVFDLSVTHGCIGMGWTNADGSAFLRERQIDAPRNAQAMATPAVSAACIHADGRPCCAAPVAACSTMPLAT
jgi:hypothetical protein